MQIAPKKGGGVKEGGRKKKKENGGRIRTVSANKFGYEAKKKVRVSHNVKKYLCSIYLGKYQMQYRN